jgi:predicted ATP-grasp superfamily ATP-dependent carboligase
MNLKPSDIVSFVDGRQGSSPPTADSTLVMAFSGWMDGGEVSTGTVKRLVDLLSAEEVAEIDPEPFYISNFPGSMEIAALFRPHIEIRDGLVSSVIMPRNVFFAHSEGNLVMFVGREPNMSWRLFAESIMLVAERTQTTRILFVGSFGGPIPHTREPRMYVTCSDAEYLAELEKYAMRRSHYEGPGSFTTYLMTQASAAGIQMASLVAEVPDYLQGTNPASIEAVTRRLATILRVPVNLDALRAARTKWELDVSTAVDQDDELSSRVRELEQQYDNDLLLADHPENDAP